MCAVEGGLPVSSRDEVLSRLEALIGQEHISEHYVRFRISLLKAQWAACDALEHVSGGSESVAQQATRQTGKNGHPPALDARDLHFDHELLATLLSAVCAAAARHGSGSDDAERLRAAADKDPEVLERLATEVACGSEEAALDALSQRLEVSLDALAFFGAVLAAPVVTAATQRIAPGADRSESPPDVPGCCPLCGSPPAIAILRRDDGRRVLSCSLCGRQWRFARLACPYCDNRDEGSLITLRVSQDDPRWIETCEQCQGYIKTVDERKLPVGEVVVPVVEETATLHLDLLAEKEGCRPHAPGAACAW